MNNVTILLYLFGTPSPNISLILNILPQGSIEVGKRTKSMDVGKKDNENVTNCVLHHSSFTQK